jgi:hypothetical protein
MRHGPSVFPPQWDALHDKTETLWRLENRVVSQDSMGTIAEAQRAYCRRSAQVRADALLDSLQDGWRTVRVLAPHSSAVPAAQHLPGWIPSRSQEPLNSRVGSSRLLSDTASASPSCPSMPPPCSAAAEPHSTARTPTTTCDAPPLPHISSCAMIS